MDRLLLGKRIKAERIRCNLTQEQLAELSDVSTTYIGFVERGERSITLEKLIDLASCLHVSVDFLLQDVLPEHPSSDDTQIQALWHQASPDEQSLILSLIKTVLSHTQKSAGKQGNEK
jgi:transcriptional regulator with XRE-family HTH domain